MKPRAQNKLAKNGEADRTLQKLSLQARMANSEAFVDPAQFQRYEHQLVSASSAAQASIKNQKNIYNFNTINVVGTPAHLGQAGNQGHPAQVQLQSL